MRFFIQVRNTGPFEHPISEENLRFIFSDFDPDNPPHGYEEFIRVPEPEIGPFELISGSYYEKVDGVWQDVHYVRQLNAVERADKRRLARELFPYKSWIMNEETLEFFPPVEKPLDGNQYDWSEEKQEWLIIDEHAINVEPPK